MDDINLFNSHVEHFNTIETNEEKYHYTSDTIIPKIKENSKGYFGGILLCMNSNCDTVKSILECIGETPFTDSCDKFFILKRFLMISSKLNNEKKLLLTKILWSIGAFRSCFKFFLLSIKTTSKAEKENGPFCSLFSSTWGNDFDIYMESLIPLMSDKNVINVLIEYITKFAKLNSGYVENDPEDIKNNCSSVDFNTNIVYIMIRLEQYINEAHQKEYYEAVGMVLNMLFVSLAKIKVSVELQCMEYKGTPSEQYVKQSHNRICSIYEDTTVNDFIKVNLLKVVKSMETMMEFENMCLFLIDKYDSDYTDITLKAALLEMKSLIVKNTVSNTTASIFLDLFIKRAKIAIQYDNLNDIIMNIFNSYKKGDDDIINNGNAFLNFLEILNTHYTMDNKAHKICTEMMRKMNNIVPKKGNLYAQNYRLIVLSYYIDASSKSMSVHKNDKSVLKELMESTLNTFVIVYEFTTQSPTNDLLIKKVGSCISMCELSKKEIEIVLLKLKAHMSPDLHKKITDTLSYKDKTEHLIYDHLFNDKKIVNPMFINLTDKEIIIDSTTIDTPEFLNLIEGITTLSEVINYNLTQDVINKKLNFINLLNVHKS